MKFRYQFSNLIGTVYRKGNLCFTSDGSSLISPVGNRISKFNLKSNKSSTFPIESRTNIISIALSPDNTLMILVNESYEVLLCSLISGTVLHHQKFHRPIYAVKFSPDGRKFAVCKQSKVLLFDAPRKNREINPFHLEKVLFGAFDDNICIDWTTDSNALAVGSKDMNVRVYAAEKLQNFVIFSLGGHRDCVVGVFFEHNSMNMYTLSGNGQLIVWKSKLELSELEPWKGEEESNEEAFDDESEGNEEREESDDNNEENVWQVKRKRSKPAEKAKQLNFQKVAKHWLKDAFGAGSGDNTNSRLTNCDFHKKSRILVTGFSNGSFLLHEMPEFNFIHSLNISDQEIMSVAFNPLGDWIAFGCGGIGQLLVWEWQSQTYVLKQQGHYHNINAIDYSNDGQNIVSGGDDGKVKVWNTSTGFCFVTFNEHTSAVTAARFHAKGNAVVSASLDGTVRAFDLTRYRNFRTFTSPRPVQFTSLALDPSSEVVAAGAQDQFDIFLWSMKTGHLLDVLSAHQGPVSGLDFSLVGSVLVSSSWDKTTRVWNIYDNKGARESFLLPSDAMAVTFRPDGTQFAVSTLSTQILFFDPNSGAQQGSIEGKMDVGYTVRETDKVSAKKLAFGRCFMSLCYSADGSCILAGGISRFICLYHVQQQILIRRFEVSINLSYDGTRDFLNWRKMTQWGNVALVDKGDGDEDVAAVSLPGVKKGDLSSRHFKPELRVTSVRFSPTGEMWAAATTEGLLIYSLNSALCFDPYELDPSITPERVRAALDQQEWSTALMLAVRLNEEPLIEEVVEKTPTAHVELVLRSIPIFYVERLIEFFGYQIEKSAHLQFYMIWCQKALYVRGTELKSHRKSILPALTHLQRHLVKKYSDLSKICESSKYTVAYLLAVGKMEKVKVEERAVTMKDAELEESEGSASSVASDDDDDDDDSSMNVDDNEGMLIRDEDPSDSD